MHCDTCDEEVGLLHECAGKPAGVQAILQEPAPGLRFAPLHYLGQTIAIARFDDKAMLRNSRDNNAILYGVPLWFVATTPMIWLLAVKQGLSLPVSIIFIAFALPIAFLMQVAVWGVCHLVARFALRGRGSLAGIARVMLLGSIVSLIAFIPLVGNLVASVWSLAIMMLTFETVHGIRRMHAFAISFGVGLVIRAFSLI